MPLSNPVREVREAHAQLRRTPAAKAAYIVHEISGITNGGAGTNATREELIETIVFLAARIDSLQAKKPVNEEPIFP